MKRTIVCLFVAGILVSCNNESKPAETAEVKVTKEATPADSVTIKMPYTAIYSSSFTIGDQKISEKVLTIFKQWDDNKLAEGRSMFADSVGFDVDKWSFHGKADSFFVLMQNERKKYKEVKTVLHAWIPVHSTDKNEDWALLWSTAYTIDMKGKVDSVNFQDTWRLNKDGKVDYMSGFQQRPPEPVRKK